jgi:hypothetical protein
VKQTGSKSNFGAIILMHARKMLKNNDSNFRDVEQNIFLLEANSHERLINIWLFILIFMLKQ